MLENPCPYIKTAFEKPFIFPLCTVMTIVELIRDFHSAYGVGNVVLFYLFEWKHRFVAVVGFASRGEKAPFESWHVAGTQWDFCCQFECQKCISLLIRSTAPCLHQGETFTEFKRLGKRLCVLLYLIYIPLQMKPEV